MDNKEVKKIKYNILIGFEQIEDNFKFWDFNIGYALELEFNKQMKILNSMINTNKKLISLGDSNFISFKHIYNIKKMLIRLKLRLIKKYINNIAII